MSRRPGDQAIRALATVSASLVAPHDVSGTLVRMLTGIRSALDVDACGIVAAGTSGRFEVLSASSHTAADLALFESQTVTGPGVEAVVRNEHVTVSGLDAVKEQWPDLASAMGASGYRSVLASPLRWNDTPLGAAAIFRRDEATFTPAEQMTLQAFADLAILVVIHAELVTVGLAVDRVEQALEGRILIEQAKGVLAYVRRIGMAEAYEVLQSIAREAGVSLTDGAERVIAEATSR